MSSYRKYIRVALSTLENKRGNCSHKDLDNDVVYRRCKCCGAFKPFRTDEDIKYKGEICREYVSIIKVDLE